MYTEIIELSNALADKSVARRRDFHKHPETAWFEMRTSAIIAKTLTELGYEVLTGKAVCAENARIGVPPKEALEGHAERVLSQGCLLYTSPHVHQPGDPFLQLDGYPGQEGDRQYDPGESGTVSQACQPVIQ